MKSTLVGCGAIVAVLGGAAALIVGSLVGHRDSVDADVDVGIERALAREVPAGVIDEEIGAYRGVALGDPESVVVGNLGAPAREGRYEYAVPDVIEGAVFPGSADSCRGGGEINVLAYRDVAFNTLAGRVCSIMVGGGGWSTTGGTAAGDSVEEIRKRFGDEACSEIVRDDPFYSQWECDATLPSGLEIHFGTDPVFSVTVGGTPEDPGKTRHDPGNV